MKVLQDSFNLLQLCSCSLIVNTRETGLAFILIRIRRHVLAASTSTALTPLCGSSSPPSLRALLLSSFLVLLFLHEGSSGHCGNEVVWVEGSVPLLLLLLFFPLLILVHAFLLQYLLNVAVLLPLLLGCLRGLTALSLLLFLLLGRGWF